KKIEFTKISLKNWNQNCFGFCEEHLRVLEWKLLVIQNNPPTQEVLEEEASINLEIQEN
ncbi:hypothetical protein TorRG33x02_063140, partial [Trema orientale]